MTTLISAGNSEGTYGRCDAKCYNAKSSHCHCICGGMNHGKGEIVARAHGARVGVEDSRWLRVYVFLIDDVRWKVSTWREQQPPLNLEPLFCRLFNVRAHRLSMIVSFGRQRSLWGTLDA